MTLFTDPFKKEKADHVCIDVYKQPNILTNNKKIKACIRFKNGETTGWHNVYGDDLFQVVTEVQEFINSLG